MTICLTNKATYLLEIISDVVWLFYFPVLVYRYKSSLMAFRRTNTLTIAYLFSIKMFACTILFIIYKYS